MTAALGAGILLVMLPKALSGLPGLAAMADLQRYGWMLLALSAGLLAIRLLGRSAPKTPAAAEPEPAAASSPQRPNPAQKTPRAESTSATMAPPATAPTPTPDTLPERPTAWGPDVFRVIEWRRFEAVVETLFAQAGFITRSQSHGADGGVDIWLHSKNQPGDAPVSIVQCKAAYI